MAVISKIDIPGDVLEKLLSTALSRRADFSEIYAENRASFRLKIDDGRIMDARYGILSGAGVRVISGEAVGYAFTADLSREKLESAAKSASRIAGSGASKTESVQAEEPMPSLEIQNDIEERNFRLDRDTALVGDLLGSINEEARSQDRRIHSVNAHYYDDSGYFLVANSEGRICSMNNTVSGVVINVLAVDPKTGKKATGVQIVGGRVGFAYFTDNNSAVVMKAARQAAMEAISKLEAVPAPSGSFPVVIGPGWGGLLVHESVGHCLEADAYRRGASVFCNIMGQRIASELVTLVDDATVPGSRGSFTFDSEGTSARRTVLIEKGVLKGLMTDRLNASLLKMPLSGNARRQDHRFQPLPRMTNTMILQGETPPEEIIASVRNGVYARNFSGGMTQTTSGEFTFSITEGYLIENGRLTRPIQEATLMGNGLDVLKNVVMVGNDFELDKMRGTCGKDGQMVPVGLGQPTIKVASLTVGGTEIQS